MVGKAELAVARGVALGAWEVNRLMAFSSGFPLNSGSRFREAPLQGAVLWEGTQRLNLIGDPRMPGSVKDRLNKYVNGAVFSRPAPDTFGTAPRTLPNCCSPGIRNGEVAVFKTWPSPSGSTRSSGRRRST